MYKAWTDKGLVYIVLNPAFAWRDWEKHEKPQGSRRPGRDQMPLLSAKEYFHESSRIVS
jgi:hypothetical protein